VVALSTGTTIIRTAVFSRELVRLLSDMYEEETAAHGYPPSHIFNVHEPGKLGFTINIQTFLH
jgi:hypothetical protein